WQDRALWLTPCPVEPSRFVNACGAGDAAVAGFLTALLRGESPERAGQLAMTAGRDSLYGADTTSGLRDWAVMHSEVGTTSSS
ncbi:MAG: PfkB family carbohydrate kinase, partial [Armatimonadota bacterium]